MKYKDDVLKRLDMINNGISTVKKMVDNNQISQQQLSFQLEKLMESVQVIVERVTNEDHEFGVKGKF